MDSLIIIDCDNFKDINDNYGHLKGDLALENISKGLRLTFRQTDIVGRIGGDEFCVYMHDIPSVDFVYSKCRQLVHNIQELNKEFQINVSIGIAILKKQSTYENLFKQADDALYRAKTNGRSQIIIYREKTAKSRGSSISYV
ncbi:MAG: GGDEF domain-containing protein [Clostridiales bacterium]|nr:GGDEF domain-containing protein [Clostridiales bacterium]